MSTHTRVLTWVRSLGLGLLVAIFMFTILCAGNPIVRSAMSTSAAGSDDWPMFHHDVQHTGYSTSSAPNTNNTMWNYATGNSIYWSSPAVADGKVYVGSYDHAVYCLSAATGAVVWSYGTSNAVTSSPAVVDGKVYVGSDDNKVYCLNATNGAFVWNYTTSGKAQSSPAVADGKVYVGSNDNKVYCLNASTGTQIWNYTTGQWIFSSPAVADGKVYVGIRNGTYYCLNAATGAFVWSYITGGGDAFSSPAVADGKVYVGSFDSKVYCLNAATGAYIWDYPTGAEVKSSPAVAYDKVYVGSQDGNVYCLDAADGAFIWSYTTGGSVYSSPAVADGKVYVASDDWKVYCLDAADGAFVWSYKTGSPVWSSPAVVDGKVYIGSNDKKVYCFGLHTLVVTITPSSADTTTKSDDPTGNYGTDTFIEALRDSNDPGSRRYLGFVMFNVSSNVPSGATIVSAYLKLCDTEGAGGDSITHSVYRVDSSWAENTLTWNTNPSTELTPTGSLKFNPSNTGYHTWDVTKDVQAWVSGNAVNYGWCVAISAGGWVTFASKEGAADQLPQLVITYVPAPAACLVVRGQNNIVYYRTFNVTAASWAGWTALPGATCDSPAAALCNNELHIVVRGMDGNTLWHGYVNMTDGAFSGWTLLSGSTPSPPTLTSNGTALSLVVRGQNSLIYYRFYSVATRTWTGWSVLPSGSTIDSPAATILANKLHIVVRGSDGNSIWHSTVDLSTTAFSGWQRISGATPSSPTLTASELRNEVYLVVRGADNRIYRNTWAGASWPGWAALPTGTTPDTPAATVTEDKLQVVVRSMDGNSLWHSSIDLTTASFSGWTLLSGSTPSKPTLTG